MSSRARNSSDANTERRPPIRRPPNRSTCSAHGRQNRVAGTASNRAGSDDGEAALANPVTAGRQPVARGNVLAERLREVGDQAEIDLSLQRLGRDVSRVLAGRRRLSEIVLLALGVDPSGTQLGEGPPHATLVTIEP